MPDDNFSFAAVREASLSDNRYVFPSATSTWFYTTTTTFFTQPATKHNVN
jgi:hypothetical protein